MNKFIISIIITVIIAAGIGGYFIFQKPAFPEPPTPPEQSSNQPLNNKCGDGICDALEKANPNLCPKDCQGQKTIQPTTTTPTTPSVPAVSANNSSFIYGLKISGDDFGKKDLMETYFQTAKDFGMNYIKIVAAQDIVNPNEGEYRWKITSPDGKINVDYDYFAELSKK